jgi:hypothetical protein
MLLWIGAVVSGVLGYRLHEWWVPSAIACVVVVVQAIMFRSLLGSQGSGLELLAFSLLINLLMFYATFGIGRSIRQRLNQRRKGAS